MLLGDGGSGSYFGSIPGDPGAIRAAAAQVGKAGSDIAAQGRSVTSTSSGLVGGAWRGDAATAFSGLAGVLASAHDRVESGLAPAVTALNEFAAVLEQCQQDLAKAEQLMAGAEADYRSAMAGLQNNAPGPKADASTLAAYQRSVNSVGDTYSSQSGRATTMAGQAMTTHQQAVARLKGQLSDSAGQANGVMKLLDAVGDRLGAPIAALTSVLTAVWLRSVVRLATDGPAIQAAIETTVSERISELASRFLSGDMDVEEVADGLGSLSRNVTLAENLYRNADVADLAGGGFSILGRFSGAGRFIGDSAAGLSILGDAYTFMHPDEGGAWGHVEQGMAVANGVGSAGAIGIDVFGGEALAAGASLGWVPVAGQVLVIGTGLFLTGDYLYTHEAWFRDSIDTAGDVVVDGAKFVWDTDATIVNGAVGAGKAAVHAVGAGISDVGHGLTDAASGVGSAAGSVAHFFGL